MHPHAHCRLSLTLFRVALFSLIGLAPGALSGCATESHHTIAIESVESHGTPYTGPQTELALGKFANSSPYMRGMFSDGTDPLGGQAKTILETHLAQTGRFSVLDRANEAEIAKESQLRGAQQALIGARYVVTGEITEFGRKTTGDRQLFGLLGRGKEQTAYSKVSLNIVDVKTSKVVFAMQGAGEYQLGDREILGTGGTSGYDATLNGKVLDLSIRDAVNKLVAALEKGEWSPGAGK